MRPALKMSEVMPKLQQFVNERPCNTELKDLYPCVPCVHECYDYQTGTIFNEAWYGVDLLCDEFSSHWYDDYFQVDETSVKGIREGRVAVTLWVSVRIEDDEQL